MRSDVIAFRVAGVAVALTALSAVTAPFAFAGEDDWNRDRGSVSADPNPAEPGAQVKLRVRGCEDDWAVASSVVFVSEVRLSTGRDDRRTLWGDAMIRSWAEPGRHDIKIKCGGRGGEREWGTIEIERRREHRPNPHHTPIWPVHAGGGGMSEEIAAKSKAAGAADAAKAADSAQLAAATKKSHDGDGPGLPHTVIGAVLAAAATLAVAGRALTLRRRRSGE
ncbi:hypothetical protein OHA37_24475 [Streptomyces sp. NBC_00335]|uniref:hypothetical protein n=1 Tax=unclassified Streptomyces TaxID=2593676 RepID=UPI00225296C1|nr:MULTISPECIES: hypothetical protein [unclassified Streptomyces]MCX5407014.1 hypothetical protein [Streptomyces sp. NBC_00086]